MKRASSQHTRERTLLALISRAQRYPCCLFSPALFVAQRHWCCPFSLSSSLNGIRCCPFSPSSSLFGLLSRECSLSVCLESECGSKFLASSSSSFEDLFILRRLWECRNSFFPLAFLSRLHHLGEKIAKLVCRSFAKRCLTFTGE